MLKKIKVILDRIINYKEPVTQGWVNNLDLKQQTGLLSVIRGNDTENGKCVESKKITRMLRYIILKDADKKNSFMSDIVLKQNKVINFLFKIYPDNKHWVEHIVGAAFNIKRNHPHEYVREYWGAVGGVLSHKIRTYKEKETKRVKQELYVQSIIDKYTDIYLIRGI